MNHEQYIASVNAVMKHDAMIRRVRDVSRDLALEVGDDFGGLALVPETGLRRAFIELIETSCGDTDKNTSYLFDECSSMKGGGSVSFGGVTYPITNAYDCWDAIQACKDKP